MTHKLNTTRIAVNTSIIAVNTSRIAVLKIFINYNHVILLLLIHSPNPIYNELFSIQQQYVHVFE